MGREKLLLDAGGGEPLVLRQQRLLLGLGLPTFLLSAPGRATARLEGVARLHDPEPAAGPLAALRAAHDRLGGELLVVAADQPRLGDAELGGVLRRAADAPAAPAVVAAVGELPQPFPGLYRPAFFAGLAGGLRSIVDALAATTGVVSAGLGAARLEDWDHPADRVGGRGIRMAEDRLTHLDDGGRPRMVDVGDKEPTDRRAVARGRLALGKPGWEALQRPDGVGKGDPLAVAQVAAVQGAKRCADWIPLAHPLPLAGVQVSWKQHRRARVLEVEVEVRVRARTGVEMEALCAASAALLTAYDMLKAVDRGMLLGPVWLARKEGGRSGVAEYTDPPVRSVRQLRGEG